MLDKPNNKYDEVDMDALRRAMAIAMEQPNRREQLESKLLEQPWSAVAEFAAGCCQRAALKLKLWQEPPAWGGGDTTGEADALLAKMLAADISQWEPDPTAALAKIEAKLKNK